MQRRSDVVILGAEKLAGRRAADSMFPGGVREMNRGPRSRLELDAGIAARAAHQAAPRAGASAVGTVGGHMGCWGRLARRPAGIAGAIAVSSR